MELRKAKVLQKFIDRENNLKELLNITTLGNACTTCVAEMGRAGHWVKALE